MWLSKRITQPEPPLDSATLGTVSIGGVQAAVVTDAEKRCAQLISPGGYAWQPSPGDDVLVVRSNELYLAGKLQEPEEIQPGEVLLFSDGGAKIKLSNDGSIEITGNVNVNGKLTVQGRRVLTE